MTAPQHLRAVLIDDEPLARLELRRLLAAHPYVVVTGEAATLIEARTLFARGGYDLVFLDVQMPGLDGLGVIKRLREKEIPLPHFILATAFDHYAVEAFQLEAMDYLLKPIEKERLAQAIDRARRTIAERQKPAPETPVILRTGPVRAKVLIRRDNRNFIVDSQDIIFATIDDGLITIVCQGLEGESTYKTIEELQSTLDPDTFWRVHRSWLVNINRIKEVIPWFKSSFQLKMADKRGTEVPVSRVQTKRLRSLLKL